ncbi:MAG: acyl-homoserine-lactone acylase, partial [Solirubrobacteraceae bacterium]|nr:acyl-homoserine-lactone acylase [Solirubrobacteraceae bacterium]
IALGKDATDNGRGMLLGNPHFPWDGSERFFQAQLTIPGKIDVAGGSLLGVPIILIGHTRHLAWSHTVSTAFRFTPFELKLVPGSPTSYVYDGAPKAMTKQAVTVKVPNAAGVLEPQTRTLYSTVQGPILTGILNLPLFPWTPASAYAMGDANAANFRYLNHFFAVDRAQSTDQLHAILNRYEGIPWVNTIAADSAGKAFYADIGAVPNVPDDLAAKCVNGALGVAAQSLLGLPILDGTTSSCAWRNDPDAAAPGILGPSHMPFLFRSDYVTNSNDSYWLSNPLEPLTGFARIIGPTGTARSLRTRNGLTMVADRLASRKPFTLRALRDLVFNDRQYAGVLFRDQLVGMCEAHPTIVSPTNGPVDVSAACPILRKWDLTDNLDSKGAALFRRFAAHVLGSVTPGVNTANPYATPFSADDPVHTPRDLKVDDTSVQAGLADAVVDLQKAGVPLDAGMRGFQYEERNGKRIPIHGGPGTLGDFNAINDSWTPGKGYIDVPHGSSFVETVQLTKGCPRSYSILTYSQSTDPTSPYFSDQTRQFSAKRWNPMRFCASQLRKDPQLRVQTIRQR